MQIRCASVLEGLMKIFPKSEVPCGQHSGRAEKKSNLCVTALETQPQPKGRPQRTAREKILLTQLLLFEKMGTKIQALRYYSKLHHIPPSPVERIIAICKTSYSIY